jgi:hypothetical protein
MSLFGGYVGPGLTAATNAVGSYEGAEADATKQKTAQIAQQIALLRQSHNDEITNALHLAQAGAADARGQHYLNPTATPKRTPEKFTVDGGVGGDTIDAAVSAAGGAPGVSHPAMSLPRTVQGSMNEKGQYFDASGNAVPNAAPFEAPKPQGHVVDPVTGEVKFFNPVAPPTDLRVTPKPEKDPPPQLVSGGVDAQGKPLYGAFDKKSRTIQPVESALTPKAGSALAGPISAKVGQFGEMLKKLSDVMPATDALNVSLGSSASQDIAAHGLGVGHMRIPGTQGVGSMLLNNTPEYARYQAALSPFILAAAHALSGARINQDQVEQIRHSIEIKPGDAPEVRAQKHKNLIDLTNSIGGALPPDAVGQQEGQMEPAALETLKGYGYRVRGGSKGAVGAQGGAAPAAPTGKTYTYGGVTYQVPE